MLHCNIFNDLSFALAQFFVTYLFKTNFLKEYRMRQQPQPRSTLMSKQCDTGNTFSFSLKFSYSLKFLKSKFKSKELRNFEPFDDRVRQS